MNRLIDIHADGLIDREEFQPRLERARRRHAELESTLESLRSLTREQAALREALACVDSFSEVVSANLDQADWTTRREILRTLIDRIVIEWVASISPDPSTVSSTDGSSIATRSMGGSGEFGGSGGREVAQPKARSVVSAAHRSLHFRIRAFLPRCKRATSARFRRVPGGAHR